MMLRIRLGPRNITGRPVSVIDFNFFVSELYSFTRNDFPYKCIRLSNKRTCNKIEEFNNSYGEH